jgi:hypothetical protein
VAFAKIPEHSAARTTWELAFFEDDDCVGEVPVLELSPHTIPRYDCLDHFGKARVSSHSRMLTVDVASSSTASSSSSTNSPSVLSAMARILESQDRPNGWAYDGYVHGMKLKTSS